VSSLIATFTGKTGADSTARVRLEQIVPAETSKFANVRDLYQAWLLAASGQPARLYRAGGCPIEFEGSTVRFFLGFYAWPSDPALPYNLTASLGQLGPGQRVEMAREYSEFVDNASIVALPFFMEDITATWETPTYTRYGERIPPPAISAAGIEAEFAREVFGAVRIAGTAIGDYHVVTVEVDKTAWKEEGQEPPAPSRGDVVIVTDLTPEKLNADKIANIEITVTVTWEQPDGTLGTDQLRLEIPQCVLDVLSFCPGGAPYYLLWCEKSSDRQVYYSGCTGEVISVRDGVNEKSYCSKIALDRDPGPWLRSLVR